MCHCEQCRKRTGSAFASNILAKPADIAWLSGQDNIKRYDHPGDKSFTNSFCTECGSRLPYLSKSGNLVIPAGSLDCDPTVRPDNNIFWEDRSSWYEDGITAPKCDRYP
ncbi:GFA family protein [Nodosilinea nodulosa]|uniref:GFA family protein n=1 Tax=Nodosilinea nodulosa TaxID=416001 RepID=UPI003BF4F18F